MEIIDFNEDLITICMTSAIMFMYNNKRYTDKILDLQVLDLITIYNLFKFLYEYYSKSIVKKL